MGAHGRYLLCQLRSLTRALNSSRTRAGLTASRGASHSYPPVGGRRWTYGPRTSMTCPIRPLQVSTAGDQMKLWRETVGLTRQNLADEAGYGYDAIKGMERGVRKPQAHVLRLADELCGARGKLAAAEGFLKPEPFPSYSHDYMQAENDAVTFSSYQAEFIPGLLQTDEIVRAMLHAHCPPLDDETIEERARARIKRRGLLNKQAKAFSFVISETALRD